MFVSAADAFDAELYGRKHHRTVEYLTRDIDNLTHKLRDGGQRFREIIERDVYRPFDESRAARVLRAALRYTENVFRPDQIRYLGTIGEIQHSPASMIASLMAEPTLRRMYHQQQVDGYSDSYIDTQPGKVGEDHYDYRRVVNGIFMEEEGELVATTFYEDLIDQTGELDFLDQIDILRTWEQMRIHLGRRKEDPTSRWNSSL